MRRYRFTYFLAQSIKGLWRNGIMTVASIGVLMGCLVVMGSFALLIMNIDVNLDKLGLLNEIVVFVEETKTDEEVSAIGENIRSLNNVAEVTFVSKEQALEEEREKYAEYSGLYDLVEGDNPLRDSFVIKYENNEDVSTLVFHLEQMKNNGDLAKINNFLDLATSIDGIKSNISMVLVWFMAILFLVSIFVIINTIKLAVHSRRTEITIMRYIGATDWFVVLPFIFEGIIIGIIAAGIAFAAQWYIYGYIVDMMESAMGFITILMFNEFGYALFFAFMGIGIVTGIIGSTISTRKYLKA